MPIDDFATPAVVLGSVRHGGLGITRSLGRLGVPVYTVERHPLTPAFYSRYSRGRFVWDVEKAPVEESVRYLQEVGKRVGPRAVLIPTTDNAAMFVAEQAERLRDWFLFPNQSAGLVRSLCSKQDMHHLAQRHGVPTAQSAFPQCRAEVLDYLEKARFPIMLKGIYGRRLQVRAGKTMFLVQTPRELLERYDELEDPARPNLMLQEYLPGGRDALWMFNGYGKDGGECLLAFTGKKVRQCPVYTGPTCLGICLANDRVEDLARRFMKAIGYEGAVDIDFHYDERDGQYKVLDVNPRIGASFRLFVGENGIDVARALYLDLTGQPVVPAPARAGRMWMVEDCDVVSCIRYYRAGELTFREWVRSLGGIRETALWALDDPVPALSMALMDGWEFLARVRKTARSIRFRSG